MLKCDVCKNESFEKFDGYMYCTECHTQSQVSFFDWKKKFFFFNLKRNFFYNYVLMYIFKEYIEQEFEFHGGTFIKSRPSKKVNKSPKNNTTVIEGKLC